MGVNGSRVHECFCVGDLLQNFYNTLYRSLNNAYLRFLLRIPTPYLIDDEIQSLPWLFPHIVHSKEQPLRKFDKKFLKKEIIGERKNFWKKLSRQYTHWTIKIIIEYVSSNNFQSFLIERLIKFRNGQRSQNSECALFVPTRHLRRPPLQVIFLQHQISPRDVLATLDAKKKNHSNFIPSHFFSSPFLSLSLKKSSQLSLAQTDLSERTIGRAMLKRCEKTNMHEWRNLMP